MHTDKTKAFKYINEYNKQKYDRITILRASGEKAKIDAIAREKGYKSTNDFINTCIDEKLKRMKIEL